MSKSGLLQLSKEELVVVLEGYSKLYTALDGLWFLSVEEEYGHDVATKLDVKVWESLIPREAERIGNARKLTGGGIEAIIEAFKLRPSFFTKEYKVIRGENRAVVRVTRCRSLDAMERDKREVSSCIRVLESVYPKFAKSIDSRVKFRVLKAPPRRFVGDTCCEWEIEIP